MIQMGEPMLDPEDCENCGEVSSGDMEWDEGQYAWVCPGCGAVQ